jgi:NTE family protein
MSSPRRLPGARGGTAPIRSPLPAGRPMSVLRARGASLAVLLQLACAAAIASPAPAVAPGGEQAARDARRAAIAPAAPAAAPALAAPALAAPPLAAPPPAEPVPAAPPLPRPRVALVLSGGGARGFAHIGVLRVLRELHVPVDMVVGTSMGSVIGGAFAAGASVAELESMARGTDWARVVADRPARDDLAFRRREEDVLLPSRIEFGVHRDGISLPPAAAGNAALEQALGRLLPGGTRDLPVNALALPFRSVASDLVTGEEVDLIDTPLFLAMRASLAVPGVFAPVRLGARLLVDGGLVRNLPVGIAHAMGAEIVIAVNVGTPLAPEHELGSAIGVAQQMINILTEQNVQRSLKEMGPRDILIAPDLNKVGFLDFVQVERAIRAGEAAARALAPRLARLAIAPGEYALMEQRRETVNAPADIALPLARLEVESVGRINPAALALQSGLLQGQPVTEAQARIAADRLYGRGDLERIETEVRDAAGQRQVRITATEADWASSRVRVGLELASDFNDANSFALKLMHVRSSLNGWGGELRSIMRVGDQREFGVQFWQPLGAGSDWFVAPSAQYGSSSLDLFNEGRRVVRLGYNERTASFVLGRGLGNWGDIQAGLVRQRVAGRVLIPDESGTPPAHTFGTSQFLRYRLDTLDSLGYPSRGYLLNATLERAPTADGTDSLASSSLIGMAAVHTDNWAGHLYGEWARAQRGAAPLSLGGFLRLSGTPAASIQGRSVGFARLVLARGVGALPLALGGVVRAGFSLEMGGGFEPDRPSTRKQLRSAGSAFLSVDTRFGPAFLGAGATKDGERTLYLFLGPVW